MILHLILFPFPIPVLGFVIESNMSLQKKKSNNITSYMVGNEVSSLLILLRVTIQIEFIDFKRTVARKL